MNTNKSTIQSFLVSTTQTIQSTQLRMLKLKSVRTKSCGHFILILTRGAGTGGILASVLLPRTMATLNELVALINQLLDGAKRMLIFMRNISGRIWLFFERLTRVLFMFFIRLNVILLWTVNRFWCALVPSQLRLHHSEFWLI